MNYSVSYSNNDDVASATWALGDYQYDPYLSVPQSTYPDPVSAPGYPSTAGSYVPDFNAAADAAFSLTPDSKMGAFANLPIQADFTNQNILDPWSKPGPSHFDANAAVPQPQPVGVPYWIGVDPLAANSAATTPDSGVSPTSTTTSQDEWVSFDAFLRSFSTTPASSPAHGGEAEWDAPEQGTNVSKVTPSPAGWDASGYSWPIPAAPGDVTLNVTTTTFSPAAALRKRCRETKQPVGDEDPAGSYTDETPPPKRARGGGTAEGIPKAARSAVGTRRKPAARIPKQTINDKPKEVGRGVERLATPSSQGIYHRLLPGPSSQQNWAVDAADGKPTSVEGRADEEAVHHTDSMVQQQREETTELFKIPRKFKPEHRLLLQTSEADVARGAVQRIKCRLCPDANLKDFEEFKRHCRTSETHPLEIHFCDRCGDYFARVDSLKRHRSQPPAECLKVTPMEAVEKCRVTKEDHRHFVWGMLQTLSTGVGTVRGFSQMMKGKYPESSKKRTGGSK